MKGRPSGRFYSAAFLCVIVFPKGTDGTKLTSFEKISQGRSNFQLTNNTIRFLIRDAFLIVPTLQGILFLYFKSGIAT